MREGKERGFTLIEVLLATAISLIGLSAGATILLLGYKHSYLMQNVTRVQQQTNISLEKMVKEFQETAVDTIDPSSIVGPENFSDIISFASARDDNNNFLIDEEGKPDWINAIIYFTDVDPNNPNLKILYRYRESKDNWDTNYPVSGFDPSQASGKELMATSVTGVEFWFSGNNLLNIKMKIVLNPEAVNPPEEEFITALKLRN